MAKRLPKVLRGNPLIRQMMEATDPEDAMFGYPPIPRTCDFCFYRHRAGYPKDPDCMLASKEAKKQFGIPENEPMPEKIDGVPVGFYCRNWTDFGAE